MTDHESQSIAQAHALLCPYCGHTQDSGRQCARCRGLFEPLSRQATQNSMGPWQVRDEANPFTPGCSFETLRALIARGRVRPDSIVRGPTTHQFWRRAEDTPGLAHLFGHCHACRASVHPTDKVCPQCAESLSAPLDRDRLGLAPVRSLSGPRLDSPLSPVTLPSPRAKAPPPAPAQPFDIHPFDGLGLPATRRSSAAAGVPALIAVVLAAAAVVFALVVLDPFSSDNPSTRPPASDSSAAAPGDSAPVATGSPAAGQSAPAAAEADDAWRAGVEASAVLAASGREEDIRQALASIQSFSRGFPEGQVPAELAAEQARLERLLEQQTLRRFVW